MKLNAEMLNDIKSLKKEHNAIILAHVYQDAAIQSIADIVGDSLALSKEAMAADADIIVFCGVRFMAETAHILNPEKTILLPSLNAGCELADMATIEQLKKEKENHPNAAVVCYINSSAEIKAASDICCTSANAVEIVQSLPQKEILFLPDKNLGSYVAEFTNKQIKLWDGYCYVHENINPQTITSLKETYPSSKIIVHPECNPIVRALADCIGGTAKMAQYVKTSNDNEFIVGTEDNFIHHLQKHNPHKQFHPVLTRCIGMEKITINDVKEALEQQKHVITLPKSIRLKAYSTLENMMKVS
jgi:quinolinate synthase